MNSSCFFCRCWSLPQVLGVWWIAAHAAGIAADPLILVFPACYALFSLPDGRPQPGLTIHEALRFKLSSFAVSLAMEFGYQARAHAPLPIAGARSCQFLLWITINIADYSNGFFSKSSFISNV